MLRKVLLGLIFLLFYSLTLVFIVKASFPTVTRSLMLLVPGMASLLFLIYGMFWGIRERENEEFLLIFGALWSLSLAWVFRWSALGMGGGVGDSWITHAMVNKFKYFWENVDFTFKGLHSFYPFYFHYALGKIAWLFKVPSFLVVKYFPVIFALILPLLLYLAFRTFLPPLSSMVTTLALLLFEGYFFVYKPYEFFVLAFLLPWWIFFIEEEKGSPIYGGIIGGLFLGTYYFWFFPFLLIFLANMGLDFFKKRPREFWLGYRRRFLIFSLSLIASAPYWGGYLWDVFTRGGEFLQHTFFRVSHLKFVPLETGVIRGGPLLWGISFLALLYLFSSYREERLSRFFLFLLLGTYIIYFLGNAGAFILLTPLLQFKFNYFLTFILIVSFSLWMERFIKNRSLKWAGVVFFILVSFFTLYKVHSLGEDRFFVQGTEEKAIMIRKDERVLFGKTVLGLEYRMLNFVPSYLFLHYGARAAHPSARINERLAFLYLLSFSSHPDFFLYMLENNKFSSVDFIYLKARRNKLCVRKFFPDYPNVYGYRTYYFCFRFTPEEIGSGKVVRNIYEKGDRAIQLKRVEVPGEMTPLERLILSKFGKKTAPAKPEFEVGPMEVYQFGRHVVFYSEKCSSLLQFGLFDFLSPDSRANWRYQKKLIYKLTVSCPGAPVRQVKYAIRKHGIVGRVCVRVLKVPEGCKLLKVERAKSKN